MIQAFTGGEFRLYAMRLIELLESCREFSRSARNLLPSSIKLAKHLEIPGPKTGLWTTVVDKGREAGNWHETSCSSMYTYMLWMGVKRVPAEAHFGASR